MYKFALMKIDENKNVHIQNILTHPVSDDATEL